MDDSKKAVMIAEVRTIRAFEYFNTAFYFGDVPLIQQGIQRRRRQTV